MRGQGRGRRKHVSFTERPIFPVRPCTPSPRTHTQRPGALPNRHEVPACQPLSQASPASGGWAATPIPSSLCSVSYQLCGPGWVTDVQSSPAQSTGFPEQQLWRREERRRPCPRGHRPPRSRHWPPGGDDSRTGQHLLPPAAHTGLLVSLGSDPAPKWFGRPLNGGVLTGSLSYRLKK